jgi:hypothetical protein
MASSRTGTSGGPDWEAEDRSIDLRSAAHGTHTRHRFQTGPIEHHSLFMERKAFDEV